MPNSIDKLMNTRTGLIDKIIAGLEGQVIGTQDDLLRYLLDEWLDKLDLDEDGNIKNTAANKARITSLPKVFDHFVQATGKGLLNTVVKGVSDILDFNEDYFTNFESKGKVGQLMTKVQESVYDWLGLTDQGKLVENGYMETILKDETIRREVQNGMYAAIVAQKGYSAAKQGLRDYIVGNPGKNLGKLQQYYRNFVYDTFSQIDRSVAKQMADKLSYNYAIYEGGIIKTTRPFCRERNGKVFSRDEIAAFNPTEAKPPNYTPEVDLGGYGCRHHLNWVPDAVAFALRPELAPS